MNIPISLPGSVIYPESDGEPMADNTKQLRWIFVLFGNLAALFRDRSDVFVGGNLFWYPVEGQPEMCAAPDVFVVIGRPKGNRRWYRQWEETSISPTVVFDILSPENSPTEMDRKLEFYEDHGVEEYYRYDPDHNCLRVFLLQGNLPQRVRPPHNFVSPRLGIRFDLSGPEMLVYRPDGEHFLTVEELKAEERVEQAERRAKLAEQRTGRLAQLSRKARRGQATTEELQELDRLEEQYPPSAP